MTFTGDDPYLMHSFLNVPPDTHSRLRVRMRLCDRRSRAQIFWATEAEPAFHEDKHIDFPIVCDGQFHDYVINVGDHPKWRGQRIRGLRLDPLTRHPRPGSTVQVDSITGE